MKTPHLESHIENGHRVYYLDFIINSERRSESIDNIPVVDNTADPEDDEEDVLNQEETWEEELALATWTRAFINDLPNSSFAVIEKGYKEGGNKNARHLPFKNASGEVDLPHLRNAWSRRNQIISVLKTESNEALRARAERVLKPYAKKYLNQDNIASLKSLNYVGATSDGNVRDRWRLISAAEAWPQSAYWWPQLVDYGHEGGKVLKEAVSLIKKSHPDLMWNHSIDVKDVAGHVENPKWEDSTDIPPGINADLVVDPQYDPKAAMGLVKGVIRNGSIGVNMKLEPSHPKMEIEDFLQKQGKTIDGNKVRWLPKKMVAVRHMALVPAGAGADPNAGRRIQADHTDSIRPLGDKMEETYNLIAKLCEAAKIDCIITEGETLPEGVGDKLLTMVAGGRENARKFNALAAKVTGLAQYVVRSDEEMDNITLDTLLERLPERLELSITGEELVNERRREALRWFDAAKVDPATSELSATAKKLRARIEKSTELDYICDMIAEYQPQAEMRFAAARKTSVDEELPTDKTTKIMTNPDIADSSKKMFGKEGK